MSARQRAEIAWGVGLERAVLTEWLGLRGRGGASRCALVPSPSTHSEFDYYLMSRDTGLPVALLEVKVRRSSLRDHYDSLWPSSKVRFARELWQRHRLQLLGVVSHPDAVAEINLTVHEPMRHRLVARRDRPGPGVSHAVYDVDQMQVWWRDPACAEAV